MNVLAVVVTHNRRALLSRCIDHLQSQAGQVPEILIINNASTDDTVAMLEARGVDFITQENVGSAGGWHRGIEAAQDRGFDALGEGSQSDRSRLRARYAALDHPMAAEVVRWLDGADTVDGWVEQA